MKDLNIHEQLLLLKYLVYRIELINCNKQISHNQKVHDNNDQVIICILLMRLYRLKHEYEKKFENCVSQESIGAFFF